MRLMQKLVLAFGVAIPAVIVAAQNVTVGDTVWYVKLSIGIACWQRPTTQSQISVVDSVEGFVMDTFCIERGTLLDKPDVVTLEGPGNHSFHWYVDAST
jgi:hypothetical protein